MSKYILVFASLVDSLADFCNVVVSNLHEILATDFGIAFSLCAILRGLFQKLADWKCVNILCDEEHNDCKQLARQISGFRPKPRGGLFVLGTRRWCA